MKQYFSLKSTFVGAVLFVSGTFGLVSTADAFDSHRYSKSSKFFNKSYSNKRYSNKHYYKYSNKKHANKRYNNNHYYGKYGKHYSNKGYYGNKHYKKRYYSKDYYHDYQPKRHYSKRYYDHGYKHNGYKYKKGHGYYNHGYDKSYSRPHPAKHQCFNYKVKAIGGLGGFRFQHDIKAFKRIGHDGYSGKICGHKHAEFELSKLDPGVKVILKINGKRFVYGSNSGYDKHINNWHRKYYSVKLGHSKHGYYD